MSQYVIYSGECSKGTGEECAASTALGRRVLNISVKSIWPSVSFKAIVSLLIFCLDDLSIVVNGMLKSPTIILLFSISFFIFEINCYVFECSTFGA